MDLQFKKRLFEKHILVAEREPATLEPYEVYVSLANLFAIKVTDGRELLTEMMIHDAETALGKHVPSPFYVGFPQSVRKLSPDELLYDQVYHYILTYGLGNFQQVGHSVFEEKIERSAFKESVEYKSFTAVSEEKAEEILKDIADNLLKSTRPLSVGDLTYLINYIRVYNYEVKVCASKDTAVELLFHFRDPKYVKFIKLPDVIRLLDTINFNKYGSKNLKKLNLKNEDRKFFKKLLDEMLSDESDISFETDIRDCFEKKKIWCGFLHHIHYKPKTDKGINFVNHMRGGINLSVYSQFEALMSTGNVISAAKCLLIEKGIGAYLRNLDYILSRCTTGTDVSEVLNLIKVYGNGVNGVMLLQLLTRYAMYEDSKDPRVFKFVKHSLQIAHKETEDEAMRRKTHIDKEIVAAAYRCINYLFVTHFAGKLPGKVFIDPDGPYDIALPIQEAASSSGFGVLPKGSVLKLPEGKKVRCFTYWEKVNDIDLSVIGMDENNHQTEFSWRTMWHNQSDAITYSGDETSGYHGGSEYFDVDIDAMRREHPDIRYMIFCDNVFSHATFDSCVCTAGFMMRDILDSGEIYEPKSVKTSFIINANSTFAYLFALDLIERRIIWLNIAADRASHVAGDNDLSFLKSYFDICKVMNVGKFFKFLAEELVTDPKDADILITDKNYPTKEGSEVISSFDTDRILALLNR